MLRSSFKKYLINHGYKVEGENGTKSTVDHYTNAVDNVKKSEGYDSYFDFAANIDKIVKKYSKFGNKAHLGEKSHDTVINALKQFEIFVIENKRNNNKIFNKA